MRRVTILGSGASLGVPVLACKCEICQSNSPYNKRLRSSVLIENDNRKVLVDFGPEIKMQLMRENIDDIEAAILTHDHADHVSGLDDLRVFGFNRGAPLPLYSDSKTIDALLKKYNYLVREKRIEMKSLSDFDGVERIAGMEVQFFRQDHYSMDSLGIRIGDMVYSNDVIKYYESSEKFLYNIKHWIVDCMDYNSTVAHSGMEQILLWNDKFSPQFMWLTNMGHTIDYFAIQKHLPDNVKPLYDGQKIIF